VKAAIDRHMSADVVALLFECPSLSPTIYRAPPRLFQPRGANHGESGGVPRPPGAIEPRSDEPSAGHDT
jgi:hypothetical protein